MKMRGRTIASLSEEEFLEAVNYYKRDHNIIQTNIDMAFEFLVRGKLQVVIAEECSVSRQLVNKQCKRIYNAYLELYQKINN